jgi:hypothetical protein
MIDETDFTDKQQRLYWFPGNILFSIRVLLNKLFTAGSTKPKDLDFVFEDLHAFYSTLNEEEKKFAFKLRTLRISRGTITKRVGVVSVGPDALKYCYYDLGLIVFSKTTKTINKKDISKVILFHEKGMPGTYSDWLIFRYSDNGSTKEYSLRIDPRGGDMDPFYWADFISAVKKNFNVEEKDIGFI